MQNIGFPFDTENSYGYGKRLRFVRHAIEKYIKENHFNKRSVKILDIGCGTGFYLTFPLMSLGYNIIGVDPDLESIEYAKRINIYPNGSFIKSELKDLSSYNIFDIIICSEVLEHVEDPETFLYILKTKLKYNGIIILTIPNGFGAYEIDSFIYHKLRVKYCLIFLSRLKKFILYILGINTRHRNNETIIPVTYKNNDIHLQYFTYNKINALFKKNTARNYL